MRPLHEMVVTADARQRRPVRIDESAVKLNRRPPMVMRAAETLRVDSPMTAVVELTGMNPGQMSRGAAEPRTALNIRPRAPAISLRQMRTLTADFRTTNPLRTATVALWSVADLRTAASLRASDPRAATADLRATMPTLLTSGANPRPAAADLRATAVDLWTTTADLRATPGLMTATAALLRG